MNDFKILEDEIMNERILIFLGKTDNIKLDVLQKQKIELCKAEATIFEKINDYKYTLTKEYISNNKGAIVFIENKENSKILLGVINDVDVSFVDISYTPYTFLTYKNFLARFYIIGIK